MTPSRLQDSPTLNRLLLAAALAVPILLGSAADAAPPDAPAPLFLQSRSQLLQSGAQAFAQGRFAESADAFRNLQLHFAEDPQWIDGTLPRKTLPLAGYAAWRSGDSAHAIAALELFLNDFEPEDAERSFARYTLAMARIQSGDTDAALDALRDFRAESPSPSHQGIAALKEAQLLFGIERSDEAFALLENVAQSEAADRVVAQARLATIRERQRIGDSAQAAQALLQTAWTLDSMPELARLAFAAMEIGDQSLQEGRPHDALSAYRLVLPKAELERRQARSLARIEARFAAVRQRLPAAEALWEEFYAGIIAAARNRLAALRETPEYADALLLRRGQSFQAAGRPLEAWLVFERAARSAEPDIAQSAQRLWIHAALAAGEPDSAIVIAKAYLEKYPLSDDIWNVAYLIAIARLEQEAYAQAATDFEGLAARAPDSARRAQAEHQAGYCYAQSEQYAAARAAFERSAEADDGPLREKSEFWIGLVDLFDTRFADALVTFRRVETATPSASLRSEAAYRIAATLYAMGEFESASDKAAANLAGGSANERYFENQLLRALASQALGLHEQAIASFSEIPQELDTLRQQAALGLSESYLALGKPDEAIGALAARSNESPSPSDAGELYQAWHALLLEQKRFPEALAVSRAGLEAYGDALEADGMLELALASATAPSHPLDLVEAIEVSRIEQRSTLLARLSVAQSAIHERGGRAGLAERILLELADEVGLEELPPEALVALGTAMTAFGSIDGRAYLDACLASYPKSQYAAQAEFALAQADLERDRLDECLARLGRAEARLYDLPDPNALLHLKAEALARSDRFAEAAETLEAILADKGSSSRDRGLALSRLGKLAEQQERWAHANAYYQRAYTLYPAFTDIACASYLGSAESLLALGQTEAARRTLEEAARTERLSDEEGYQRILKALSSLPPPPTPSGDLAQQ